METVTIESIENKIKDEKYIHVENTTMTICILTLENGFTVTGESATVSTTKFVAEIGEKFAREDAFEKIWALEGYLLKQQMYQSSENTEAK